jgi:geranylgeranyl diphosphate synthase, type II
MRSKYIGISKKDEETIASIPAEERVLLLPHCLKPSDKCEAKFKKEGLNCPEDCQIECQIRTLTKLANDRGFKGVCTAAGGVMALKFIKKTEPAAIIAIACDKELEEGVCAVEKYSKVDKSIKIPLVISIPLLQDGCVDTVVDMKEAERIIKI